jgi:hypothetical protein
MPGVYKPVEPTRKKNMGGCLERGLRGMETQLHSGPNSPGSIFSGCRKERYSWPRPASFPGYRTASNPGSDGTSTRQPSACGRPLMPTRFADRPHVFSGRLAVNPDSPQNCADFTLSECHLNNGYG